MGLQPALAVLLLVQGYLCLVSLSLNGMTTYVPRFLFRTRLEPEQQVPSLHACFICKQSA